MIKAGINILICAILLSVVLLPPDSHGFRLWRSREEIRKDALTAGSAAMEDELFDIARRHLEEALERSSTLDEELEVAIKLARSHRRGGDLESANRVMQKYTEDASESEFYAAYMCERAYIHFDAGSYRESLNALSTEVDDADERTMVARLRLLPKVHIKLGQREQALRAYEEFHEEFPDQPEAAANLLEWGGALSQAARLEEALEKLTLVNDRYPRTRFAWTAQVWKSQVLMRAGEWEAANELLSALITDQDTPDDIRAEALFYLARIRERDGDIDAAVGHLQNIEGLRISSESLHQGRIFRARLLFDSGREEQALDIIHESMRSSPEDPLVADTHLEMANLLFDRGMYAEALREFQYHIESLEDPVGYGDALLGKAWALYETGDMITAAEAFERAANAFEADRLKEEALHKAGDAYLRAGRYDNALELYVKTLETFHDGRYRPQTMFQKAEVLRRLERVDDAQDALAELRNHHPESTFAQQSWIRSARNEEERFAWDAALEIYTGIIEREGDSELGRQALHDRGIIYYRLSRFENVLDDFQALIQTDDDSLFVQRAFFMRGWCYYLTGDTERALEICKDFLDIYPESQWAQDVNFWISNYYFNKGMFAEAEQRFSQMAEKNPDGRMTDAALFWAAQSSLKQREYVRAVEYLGELVENFPDSKLISEARFSQGDALAALGRFAEAILAFEEIVKNSDANRDAGYFATRAWGRIGDCNFTLASDDPERYRRAIASYNEILENPSASMPLKLQSEFKIGRSYERMGEIDEAFDRYMNVVYEHLREVKRGQRGAPDWFTRAAFGSAQISESRQQWRVAINIYQRVLDANVPQAPEAQRRIREIRLEHWILF